MQTQWRRNGKGWRTGLDYNGVETVARLIGITLEPEQFAQLQAMEREVIRLDDNQGTDEDQGDDDTD